MTPNPNPSPELRKARLAHAKAWLCKRWSQEHPNAQHVIQLADYAEALSSPDAAGSGGEALHIRARKADEVAKRTAGDDLPDATQTREAELVAALEPFAFKGATIPRDLDRDLYFFTDSLTGMSITLGHVLDARAALNGRGGA